MTNPWLSIIGLTEAGLDGLAPASRAALDAAEVIFGAPRHLALVGAGARGQSWPVPFDIAPVLALRGGRVAVLASGDPFWHGAGGSLTDPVAGLTQGEWQAFPAPSVMSLAAAHLGWRLEEVTCLGLHAAPLSSLRAALQPGARLIVTLRDGVALHDMAALLLGQGQGAARVWVMENLGGPRARVRRGVAGGLSDMADVGPLVTLALHLAPDAPGLPLVPGRPDALFSHDGQITKSPVRAVTLAALAPRRDELLWDLGAGSGSVSVEWCLAGGRAIAVETRPERLATIEANIAAFGLSARMRALCATLPLGLETLPAPAAIFVGGGFSTALFDRLRLLAPGARLVVNAVTLETEALVSALHQSHGGTLTRMEFAQAQPLGSFRGWVPARPVVLWSVPL